MIIKFALILAMVIAIFLTFAKTSYRNIWGLNLLCCIILSILAYHLIPLKSLDIYRYYTQMEIAKILGVSREKVKYNIAILKVNNILERIGSNKIGEWKILK